MPVEDMFKSGVGKGLAIGLGIAVLAPLVLPVIGRVARPAARAAIKSGIIFFEKGQEMAAEFVEVVDDLIAEAKAEVDLSQETGSAEATDTETPPQASKKSRE